MKLEYFSTSAWQVKPFKYVGVSEAVYQKVCQTQEAYMEGGLPDRRLMCKTGVAELHQVRMTLSRHGTTGHTT
jgi:hypothetical protein